MEKYYSFAGVELAVSIPDDLMYSKDRALEPFRVKEVNNPHRFDFELVDALAQPMGECIANEGGFRVYPDGDGTVRYIGSVRESWESAYLRVTHYGYEHHVQVKRSKYTECLGVHTVLTCLAAEHLVAQNRGVIFHSSYIERDGRGILFTAPSGTGKSTQAALWEQLRGAEILNGDRSVIRMMGDDVEVCGIPFAGSSQICKNVTFPLCAIVYLKQAPQTTIRHLRGAEAFRKVWEGCSVNTWNREDVELVSELVQNVLMSVPVFELACTPDESAVIALEGALDV